MVLKRVGLFSAGKLLGVLSALMGLLVGAFFALAAMLGAEIHLNQNGADLPQLPAAVFGVGAVVIIPIFYGVVGFIAGIIYAAMYNVVASITGGLEVDFEQAGTHV